MKQLLPTGTRYYLPPAAAAKRQVESRLVENFGRWGYGEIITPTIELQTTMGPGTSPGLEENAYKFFDTGGSILRLRPDLTTPIAYLAATRLGSEVMPLRFFYQGNVFRLAGDRDGQRREIYQTGVELLGAPGDPADTEVVALAVSSLQAAGLGEFQIGLGQVDFIEGMLDESGCTAVERERIRSALSRRDFVGYREAVRATAIPAASQARLDQLPSLSGRPDGLAAAANLIGNGRAREALANLERVHRDLAASGLGQYLYPDLSLVRNLDYYTGIVFEAYAAGLGSPVLGGGRYDRLIGNFGTALAATGFAIGVEQLVIALERQDSDRSMAGTDYLVVARDGRQAAALGQAAALRERGYRVEMELLQRDIDGEMEYAREKGISRVSLVGEKGIEERLVEAMGDSDNSIKVTSLEM